MAKRYDYRTALRAKGIRPLPPYRQLRSAPADGYIIQNPALAKQQDARLLSPARGEAFD
jgi:hypothetical protein